MATARTVQPASTVTTGRRALLGGLAGLVVLGTVGWLGFRNTLDLVAARRSIAHTHDVLDAAEAALAIVKDNEIAVRDSLVTRDDELARRRELARPALQQHLDRLRELTRDNPTQQRNVDALDAAVLAKLAYSDDVLEARRTRDFPVEELSARLAESLRRTDETRGLAAQIQHEERRLLAIREDAARAGTSRALFALAGGTLLGVTLLASVLGTLHREVMEHRATESELRLSERRLTLALDASQMGLWDLDLRTDESHRTLRHDQIFGYDTLQPYWGREIFRPHLHPDDREIERQAFESALATDDFHMECRILRHGDRAVRWISSQGKLFRDERGEPRRMMGSVIDVTERREAEERLRERSQQLEAANEALGSFTYSVSHDLRAPLRAINGYAHILSEDHGDALNSESRRVLGVICDNARQMGQLIDDLLRFSRLGRQELEQAPTDLEALTRSVIDELRRAEPDRALQIDVAPLPTVIADASMLRHVIANLVGNAWKFTRGRADARIEIGCTRGADETVYAVKDNGAGFDMQYAGKLFGVFQRLHRAEDFEGTGVGLAIVQRVVQRHGGRVWAEGAIEHGATFCVALPNGKGVPHESGQRGDSVGRGQPGGRRAGSASAQEA